MTVVPVPDSFEERCHCVIHAALEADAIHDEKACAECERRLAEMLAEK
jgi:hypothetical protein